MMGAGEIYGLDAGPLPEGAVPLEAFAIVKRFGPGETDGLSIRTTAGFDNAELATLLRVEAARLEARIAESWHQVDDDG